MLAKINSDTWKNATVDRNVTKGFIEGYCMIMRWAKQRKRPEELTSLGMVSEYLSPGNINLQVQL